MKRMLRFLPMLLVYLIMTTLNNPSLMSQEDQEIIQDTKAELQETWDYVKLPFFLVASFACIVFCSTYGNDLS